MNKKKPKQPRKISARYLENAALYYLQRYATSAENLKTVLCRKIDRSCAFHKTDPAGFYGLVDKLVERYKASGLLNDAVFARAKTTTLRRKGESKRAIEAKLSQKGLAKEDIARAFAEVDESEDAEFDAAVAFVKRKKLGTGRKEPQKEMAAMARAGFSFEVAKRALAFEGEEN